MPLCQTIGISLALLMASACTMTKSVEQSAAYHPATPPTPEPQNSPNRSGRTRVAQRVAHARAPLRALYRRRRARARYPAAERVAQAGGSMSSDWGAMHPIGPLQIGKATWYGLVGDRTASGERLDTVSLTAAHRSLPLGSCAKVTELDTGQSVIVTINDRGPYAHGVIIDLSPRAAQELGMRHQGVAAVAVEPVAFSPSPSPFAANGAGSDPTIAASGQTPDGDLSQ
jgi:peptidoglycan lytic transglycosylase